MLVVGGDVGGDADVGVDDMNESFDQYHHGEDRICYSSIHRF